MVSDVEKARPNNRMLVGKNWNGSRMTVGNMSGRAFYQCGVLTAIERWGLVYWKVGKGQVVSEYGFNKML